MRPAALSGLLLAALVSPGAAGAQAIVGTVTEGGSDRPVVGAMVRLHAEDGAARARHLTAGDGRYRLAVPEAGSWWLSVERIGFATSRLGPVAVGPGETVDYDVEVATAPVRLAGLDVEASRRRCFLGSEEGDQTQLVWDEARKALSAATWTEREVGLRFVIDQWVRELDPRGRSVVEEFRTEIRPVGANSVRSLPPEELAREGYVQQRDGFVYYYGPDAEALLSDAFLETHCFQLVEGPDDEPGLVGLSFEPVPDRDTTDVEGVLLLDRESGRLERVEFGYTGLGDLPGGRQARGMVRFLELDDGRWIVRDWFIRAPVAAMVRNVGPAGRLEESLVVGSVQEFASEVRSVEGPGGIAWRADRPEGGLEGVVWDSIRGGPLAGAEIRVAGHGWRARTDEEGRWRLEGLPRGRYRVGFRHPRVDSLGVEPEWVEAAVRAGEATEVPLALPSLARLVALECPAPAGGVVVGFVRDGTGRPLADVDVVAFEPPDEEDPPARVVTDAAGTFRFCGLPPEREITVEAVLGPIRSTLGTVTTVEGRAVRVDLVVGATTEIRTEADEAASQAALVGTVLEMETDEPVDGVVVELARADGESVARRVTGADGRFRILPGEPGRYLVRTQRLGFAPVEGQEVELGPGTKSVEIHLAREALDVEGVVVEVEGRDRRLELAGFYDRKEQGLGLLLDREELQAMNLNETGDIVHRVTGLRTLRQTTRGSMDSNRRFLMFRRAARGSSSCMPAIFVDGSRIREGGEWSQAMPSLDELIPVGEVEALELYEGPATTPSQFASMGSACGVIVIWTRSPERGP